MSAIQAAAIALLWITGAMTTACAQTSETKPEPRFEQEPPPPPDAPPPPRRHGGDPDSRQEPPPPPKPPPPPFGQEDDERRDRLREKMRRLEAEMHELEMRLENKDTKPEERKELEAKLQRARGEMRNLQAGQGGRPKDAQGQDRLWARLREIEEILKKGVGPEDQKELMAEKMKIHEALRRNPDNMPGGPGQPPLDPEAMKLQRQAMELEHQSFDLSAKLRSLPKDSKDDRAEITAKLKETVVQLFDIREKARAREVDMIKKRLEELTQLLEKRKSNRDAIIEKRLKQLSGESDDLDW
jgi:hypothetical protein